MLKSTPVLSSQDIKKIESEMMDAYGVPGVSLMECAGLQTALFIQKYYPIGQIFVILGKGGNSGDGLAAARHLYALGRKLTLIFLAGETSFKDQSLKMLEALKGLPISRESHLDGLFATEGKESNTRLEGVVLDAVFGSGFKGPLKEPYLSSFKQINKTSLPVISLDVPSGQVADSNVLSLGALRATHTLVFGFYRICHVLPPARSLMGNLSLIPIGHFPSPGAAPHRIQVVDGIQLPARKETGHKNSFGHVLIIGGSHGMIGAPILAAIGALRSGAGLVSVIVPEQALMASRPEHPPELMVVSPPGSGKSFQVSDLPFLLDYIQRRKITALAIGMGLGQGEGISTLIQSLLSQTEIPVVVDADGLVLFKNRSPKFQKIQIIVTPHPGEYEAYFRKDGESNEISDLAKKAKDLGVQLIYKTTSPVVTNGTSTYIIPQSYSSLAKAGSGDVLSGILASFMAQGFGEEAAVLGAWFHNQIGRELVDRGDSYTCTASDIAQMSQKVMRRFTSESLST
jgi:NAD(P)H-hydrate epimerase